MGPVLGRGHHEGTVVLSWHLRRFSYARLARTVDELRPGTRIEIATTAAGSGTLIPAVGILEVNTS